MRPNQLKQVLRQSALAYAQQHEIPVDSSHKSAVIFDNVANAFCSASFRAICENEDWRTRTQKSHPTLPGVLEMQSSNSSDALLMNIFCHPMLRSWKGVADTLGFAPVNPSFGVDALVAKEGTNGDATEIDMAVAGCFVEAKLTEADFTDKEVDEVRKYEGFSTYFHTDYLPIGNNRYQKYQIIRNLLAAIQHD